MERGRARENVGKEEREGGGEGGDIGKQQGCEKHRRRIAFEQVSPGCQMVGRVGGEGRYPTRGG